ncbi:hypothetical protein HYU06_05800 [Candidatus Woesearchaeota archaeon]|nr:hypothetical protein [Candidatus Woesearchaeota archaeon]
MVGIKITTNAADIAKRFQVAVAKLENAKVKTHRGAAAAGQRFARNIAPRKTGRLKQGITIIRYKNSTALISKAIGANNFPYNLWVNENIRTVRLNGRGRRRTYASTNKTGVPRYFDLTTQFLQTYFPMELKNNVNRALRSSFR